MISNSLGNVMPIEQAEGLGEHWQAVGLRFGWQESLTVFSPHYSIGGKGPK